MNSQGLQQQDVSSDNYHSFASNSTQWQDPSIRFRAQGHYQGAFYINLFLYYRFLFRIGPYPTSNTRMRQHGG